LLASPDYRARAAATRVLCYWRDRVSNVLDLLKRLAADEHPRVRLEAVRAASFFTAPEAVEIPLIAADHPTDYFLDYARTETMRALDPYWKKAVADGQRVAVTSEAGARFFLRNMTLDQLLKLDRSRAVYLELLFRPGVRDEVRREALRGLAKQENKSELRVLLDAIKSVDEKRENRDESVVFDLVRQLTGRGAEELAEVRGDLERLATSAKQPAIRQIGYVMLIAADGSVDKAWELGARSVPTLTDLVNAVPYISDASLRADLAPRIEPLLHALPAKLAASAGKHKGTSGRFVRIELPGKGTLTLAEVEVLSDGRNVARQGKASQKNTAHGGDAARAIDGKKSGSYGDGGQTHSEENTDKPWWEVDLGEEVPIDSIVVYNRTDGDLGKRLDGFSLKILDASRHEVAAQQQKSAPAKAAFEFGGGGPEGIVRRAAMNALTYIRGQEQKTFATLAGFVRDDVDRVAAIRALQRIPRKLWPQEESRVLLDSVLASIRKIPTADRTAPAALDALEFADALASLLPADAAKKVRAELGELGVRVIRIDTLPERMAYDQDVIAVRAGKPIEILFENSDLMPHNFVITQPGAMAEIGLIAEETATQPGALERSYVPQSGKILLSSTLLQPRDSQRLSFTAPTQAGVYPYVCTYPGHWRRMYGALYVVDDLDQYLANPEAYLAANPLPIKDELLADRRPRTEWKYDDLAAVVAGLKSGRSYGSGKQMFQVASCIACHRLDGVGNEFGADLTKLDPKLKPADILKDVLEPSSKINEKYQSYIFELESGKVVTGLVLSETPSVVKIIENPLAKAQPLEIKKTDIAERKKSPVSLMPKGLLDKLTREEILDLVAFLTARGNKNHELFKGDHEHHHEGH
jgi:putative heme-binding domain-containing protein